MSGVCECVAFPLSFPQAFLASCKSHHILKKEKPPGRERSKAQTTTANKVKINLLIKPFTSRLMKC